MKITSLQIVMLKDIDTACIKKKHIKNMSSLDRYKFLAQD